MDRPQKERPCCVELLIDDVATALTGKGRTIGLVAMGVPDRGAGATPMVDPALVVVPPRGNRGEIGTLFAGGVLKGLFAAVAAVAAETEAAGAGVPGAELAGVGG